jgi:hypothetical protein
MNAWKLKVFCTWEFRITSICINKYTTQRKMFKLSIIQVCIRYKMGQLTAEQRIFKRLWLIWFERVHFFIHLVYSVYKKSIAFQIQINDNYQYLIVLNCFELMIRDENMSYLQKRSIYDFILMLLVLYRRVFHWVVRTCHISRKSFVLLVANVFEEIIACQMNSIELRRYAWFKFERLYFFLRHTVQGVPKNAENYWNHLLLKFECPTKKLNVMMHKILTRCMY